MMPRSHMRGASAITKTAACRPFGGCSRSSFSNLLSPTQRASTTTTRLPHYMPYTMDPVTPPSSSSSASESAKGVWSEEEHNRFLEALQRYPNGPWKLVSEHVGTRSVRQVQTHAQKYHEKVARRLRGLRKDRKRVQRPEHRIDDDMIEICHELTRDRVPLPARAPRPAHVTGILDHTAKTVHHQDAKMEDTFHDEVKYSEVMPTHHVHDHHHHHHQPPVHHHSWSHAALEPYPESQEFLAPSFDDCLDYLIDALSSSDSEGECDDGEMP